MKKKVRNNFLIIFLLSFSPLRANAQAINIFTAGADANWNTVSNWSLNHLPTSTELVRIFNQAQTIILPQSINVFGIEITNCTLSAAQPVDISCTEQFVLRKTSSTGAQISVLQANRVDIGPNTGSVNCDNPFLISANSIGIKNTQFSNSVSLTFTGKDNSFLSGGNQFLSDLNVLVTAESNITFSGKDPDVYNSLIINNSSPAEIKFSFANGLNIYNQPINILNNLGKISFGQNGGKSDFTQGIIFPENLSSGNYSFSNCNYTSTSSALINLSNTADVQFLGNNKWSAPLHIKAGNIRIDSSVFNANLIIEKTGKNNSVSLGGNTFNGKTEILTQDSGFFLTAQQFPDVFNDSLVITSNVGKVLLSQSKDVSQFNAPLVLAANSSVAGVSFGQGGGQSLFTSNINTQDFILGTLSLNNITVTADENWQIICPKNVSVDVKLCTFNSNTSIDVFQLRLENSNFFKDLDLIKRGDKNIFFSGNNTFSGSTEISISDSGSVFMAQNAGDIFSNDLLVNLEGNGSLYLANSGQNTFDGTILLNNTGSGSVFFGQNSGESIINTINVINWDSGELSFKNCAFPSTNALVIEFNRNGKFSVLKNCDFAMPLNVTAGSIRLDSSIFESKVKFTKNGSSFDVSAGGNSFLADVEVQNIDSGSIAFGGFYPDHFFKNSSFQNDSSGAILLWHGAENSIFENQPKLIANSGQIRTGQFGGSGIIKNYSSTNLFDESTLQLGRVFLKRFNTIGTDTLKIMVPPKVALFVDSTVFNQNTMLTANESFVSNTLFNKNLRIIKSAGNSNFWQGGNAFNGNVALINTSNNSLAMGSGMPDVFNGNLFLQCQSGAISIGHSSDSTIINGELSVDINNATLRFGQNKGKVYFSKVPNFIEQNFHKALVYIKDCDFSRVNQPIDWALDSLSTIVFQGQNVFIDSLSLKVGSYWLEKSTFTKPVFFTKTGANSNIGVGPNRFFDRVWMYNKGQGNINISFDKDSADVFYSTLFVAADNGAIKLGINGANTEFVGTANIQSFGNHFINNSEFSIANFKINEATNIDVSFVDNSKYSIGPNVQVFNEINIEAPLVNVFSSQFYNKTNITSSSSDYFVSTGNNVFWDTVNIFHNGTSGFGFLNSTFYDKLNIELKDNFSLFILGTLSAYGDVSYNSPLSPRSSLLTDTLVLLGNKFQEITIDGFADDLRLRKLRVNKTANSAIIKRKTFIRDLLEMQNGVVEFEQPRPLVLGKLANVIASNNTYVDGYIETDGAYNQVLPLGKNGIYAPIEMRGVAANSKVIFTFFDGSILSKFPNLKIDPSIEYVNPCGYWQGVNINEIDVQVSVLESDRNNCSPFYKKGVESRFLFTNDTLNLLFDKEGNNAGFDRINGAERLENEMYFTTGSFLDFRPTQLSADSLVATRFNATNNKIVYYKSLDASVKSIELIRSYNNGFFTLIDSLMPADNQSFYQFTDVHIGNGKYQYIISETDSTGFKQYSDLREINIGDKIDVELFPNPNNGAFELKFNFVHAAQLHISLMSSSGMLIKDFNFYKNQFDNTLKLNFNDVKTGLYIFKIESADGTANFKINILSD